MRERERVVLMGRGVRSFLPLRRSWGSGRFFLINRPEKRRKKKFVSYDTCQYLFLQKEVKVCRGCGRGRGVRV